MKGMQEKDIYYSIAYKIAKYLAKEQNNNGSFLGRNFCAQTFSTLLWSYFRDEFELNIQSAINYYTKKDKRGSVLFPHPWEFNNYALLHYHIKTKDPKISPLIGNLRFVGDRVANWTLLRATCRFLKGGFLNVVKANLELIRVLLWFQKNGFIFDETGHANESRSLQYHCYSMALLAEIYELTRKEFIKKRFLQGVDYITRLILPNGDALYVGRGQEQIFGYAALVYVLEYAHKLTKRLAYKQKADKVMSYLLKFQREDSSFPLVLREEEKEYPEEIDPQDDRFLGWYGYNDYFDYLSFLGYYLMKAHMVRVQIAHKDTKHTTKEHPDNTTTYQDDNFLLYSGPIYTAVISRPGGYWTNDMPFPYVCYRNESIFPCYGGEQRLKSVYTTDAIPLPFGVSKSKVWELRREIFFLMRKIRYFVRGNSYLIPKFKPINRNKLVFRDKLKYKLTKNKLIGRSRYVDHTRIFEFQQDTITINDKINFKKSCRFDRLYPINYPFFDVRQITDTEFIFRYKGLEGRLIFSNPCYIEEEEFYCARGAIKAVRERMTSIKFDKGNSIVRNLIIELK